MKRRSSQQRRAPETISLQFSSGLEGMTSPSHWMLIFNSYFCGRPWSPNAARTLYTSKGLRLATKLNPSLLANRTPSASNKPLPTDGLFPAHTLDLSLSAVQRCRPGWAGPRRHSPSRARSPSRPSSSSPARLSGAPVTSFFDSHPSPPYYRVCRHVASFLVAALHLTHLVSH